MEKTNKAELSKSLLSNKTAKSILVRNSIQDLQFSRDCKSLEKAARGLKVDYQRTKKRMEKRLERHLEDTLKKEDIRSLQKYIGDESEEDKFLNDFGSGKKLSSMESRMYGRTSAMSVPKYVRPTNDRASGRDIETSMGIQGLNAHTSAEKASKYTKTLNTEAKFSGVGSRGRGKMPALHGRQMDGKGILEKEHKVRAQFKQGTNAWQKSAKTAQAISANADNLLEKCSSLVARNQSDPQNAELDVNNNVTQERCDNAEQCDKPSQKKPEASKEFTASQRYRRRVSEYRNGLPVPERIGPTPQEIEEERKLGRSSVPPPLYSSLQRRRALDACAQPVNTSSSGARTSPRSTRTRRVSCGERSLKGRSSSRNSTIEKNALRAQGEFHNEVTHTVQRRISDSGRSWDGASWTSEPLSLSEETAVNTEERPRNSRTSSIRDIHLFHKSNSCPTGLGNAAAQRSQPYSEEPFYLPPKRRLSRRISWQKSGLNTETLKNLQEIHRKACENTENDNQVNEEERPLNEILPPITLPKIYVQESSNELRSKSKLTAANKSRQKPKIDIEKLTKNLRDCRYLRLPKSPITTKFV